MNAEQALAELRELSSQVARAVVLDESSGVVAGTDADAGATEQLAEAARALLAAAGELRGTAGDVARAEVELAQGGFFVLREGGRTIAATTGPGPTAGLVVYDLRTCLTAIDAKPKRRRAPRKKADEEASA